MEMDLDLMEAARAGNINALYETIKSKPNILDGMDEKLFVETPLHVAASAGHTHFALEIMRLKPSFGKKLNPDGLSPLHLALQNKHSEIVKRLIKFDSELIRVKGRESLTPLHYVAGTDDQDALLAEFLSACPSSIKDVTIREETALHIAVKSSSLKAIEVLLRWLRSTYNEDVLCSRDEEGNTVLHSAVSTSQPEIVKLLVKEIYTDKKAKNLKDETAFDMAKTLPVGEARTEIEKSLGRPGASTGSLVIRDIAKFLMSPRHRMEALIGLVIRDQRELSEHMQNMILVVAVLIATATFQAILQPPGGGGGGGGGGGMDDNNNYPAPTNATHNIFNATIFSAATNTNTTTTNFIPTNITHFSATIFTTTDTNNPAKQMSTKSKAYRSFFFDFYTLNTVCFIASITAMIFVLPLRLSSVLLHISLLFLILSYGIAFYAISPTHSQAIGFFLATYIAFPCIYSVWKSISIIPFFLKTHQYRFVPHKLRKSLQTLRDLYKKSIEGPIAKSDPSQT